MILVVTHKEDYTADFIINKFNQRKIPYRRFNCEDLFDSNFKLYFDDKFVYSLLGESDYNSVWFRRTKLPPVNNLSASDRNYILGEIDSFFSNLFLSLPARWLSQPTSVYRAENKLFQLKTAQEIGFKIPKTIVTNSHEEINLFYKENKNNIIIKPLSNTKIQNDANPRFIFTNKLTDEYLTELEKYDITPSIFQEYIEKELEIRITVIGEKVYTASVFSQEDDETRIDWRKKKLQFHRFDLPSEIEIQCVRLVKSLGLEFGAIDMIKNNNGEYIFLEINPNGQWVWIETDTGLEISESIIEFLATTEK